MDKKSALEQAIALTDEILSLLEEGEFNRINELEILRKSLITEAFSDPVEQIDLIKAQHLKNLNQQVVDRLNLLKQSIMMQQNRLRNGVKATRAYRENDSVPT